jgi:AraC family transcriptional regulator, positive regulator of tynA and feaB
MQPNLVITVERHNCEGSLPEWADALSRHVAHVLPSNWDEQLTRSNPTSGRSFSGRIETGVLENAVLSKTGLTPHFLSLSVRGLNPTVPAVLVAQVSGSSRLEQHGRSCTLDPGDWCLIDTLHRFELRALQPRNEHLNLTFERPSDPERIGLLERGAGRRWKSKAGMSRILQATLTEACNQMNRLGPYSRRSLQRALTEMTWDAVREQIDAPPPGVHRDRVCARIKTYIEGHLADPDLSVESVAQACGMSVRSIHRAFESDPAGSVSNYVWMRRLGHCAADLQDPRQAHRSITDICFCWGFNSTSHFSRVFKERFGVSPREYRIGSQMLRYLPQSSHCTNQT